MFVSIYITFMYFKLNPYWWFLLVLVFKIFLIGCQSEEKSPVFQGEEFPFKLEQIVDGVQIPFAIAFISEQKMLATNRFSNEIILIDVKARTKTLLKGIPKSYAAGDGGALDILPHPDFQQNQWLYFSHSIGDSTRSTMVIDRAKLHADSLIQIERIFTALPYYKGSSHYGNRMDIQDNYLFVSMGDRYDLMDSAQTISNHLGKILRIHDDGRIPMDNPFVDSLGAAPEIWSYGHRNPQGLTIHPETGEIWSHEHGPKGGDEINRIHPKHNYGWPIICHGIDYDHTPIGAGITHKEGMQQPFYYYVPSIAPSGMQFYWGNRYKNWKGNLFLGAMAKTHLNRLVIENNQVVHEERLLQDFGKRIRSITQGPDGFLYIGVDGGGIYRLKPI